MRTRSRHDDGCRDRLYTDDLAGDGVYRDEHVVAAHGLDLGHVAGSDLAEIHQPREAEPAELIEERRLKQFELALFRTGSFLDVLLQVRARRGIAFRRAALLLGQGRHCRCDDQCGDAG